MLLRAYSFSFSRFADMKQGMYNNYLSLNDLTLLKIKKMIAFISWLGAVLAEQALTLPPAVRDNCHIPLSPL